MAPKEDLLWQDPIPEVDFELINGNDVEQLKVAILDSGLSVPQLVRTAWASASSFRGTDMRGGANGARIALEPQVNWKRTTRLSLRKVLDKLKDVQEDFNDELSGEQVRVFG